MNEFFRDLILVVTWMAAGVVRRAHPSVWRVADRDDVVQEVLLSLWLELRRAEGPRLTDPDAVRRFICQVIRNQVARAAHKGAHLESLREADAGPARSDPDPLFVAEQEQQLDEESMALRPRIDQAVDELDETLKGLPEGEAVAVRSWLAGTSFRQAAAAAGVSLFRVRSLTFRLRRGPSPLAALLDGVLRDLHGLYRASPVAAARVWPGPLTRLLADNRAAP